MTAVLQLPLFPDLPAAAKVSQPPRVRTWREAVQVLLALKQKLVQMPLGVVLRSLERDVDTDFDFPTQARTDAATAEALQTRAPASIWALAASISKLRKRGRFGDAAGFKAVPPVAEVKRESGVTRVVGAQYPSNRWTIEREEQERARRARQKPPKPVKGAKSRGKKVREWDGETQ